MTADGIRTACASAGLIAMLLLSACGAGNPELSEHGEALTVAQADALASTRFRLAADGPFTARVSGGSADAVDRYEANVTVDPETHRAWGTVERGPEGLAIAEEVVFSPDAYLARNGDSWQPGMPPSPNFVLLFSLSADRPENSQLLRQSQTRYLGDVVDGGREFSVYRISENGGGTSSTRLWLDDAGDLHRLDAGDDASFVVTVRTDSKQQPPRALDALLPPVPDASGTGTPDSTDSPDGTDGADD